MSFIRVAVFATVLGLVHANAADNSYLRYKEQYGVPNRPLPLADVRDVQSAKLGFYCLHQTTTEDGIRAGCDQLKFQPDNRTVQAFCALANWNALQSLNDPEYRVTFLRWTDELNNSADDGRWIWTIEIPGLGIKPPWISGMTQALAVSVLLRANQLTGDEKCMATARRAMEWLSKPLEDGGCSSRDENGTWIEEYPNASDPNHVFNGAITKKSFFLERAEKWADYQKNDTLFRAP